VKEIFEPLKLERITLPHRILRAATYDNMATADGFPTESQARLFCDLARGGAGTIITGFSYVSKQGRAMQPFQAGIDSDDKIEPWVQVIEKVRAADSGTKIILQIAHTGRQTISEATGRRVVGAGPVRCHYFLSSVRTLKEAEIPRKVAEFAAAARRAKAAGFDGIQIHAAHGYLVHQFLSPYTNRRKDCYGRDPLRFLREIVSEILEKFSMPIFLKLSAAEDRSNGITSDLMASYVREIDKLKVDAIEISYGTMEIPLNIIRGGLPLDVVLRHNRIFTRFGKLFLWIFRKFIFPFYKKRFIPYSDLYNLENACKIKKASTTPILVTGGIRSKTQIYEIVNSRGLDGVTMCRPFICEPDIVEKFRKNLEYRSGCTSCNFCTVMSDSTFPLRCYRGKSI